MSARSVLRTAVTRTIGWALPYQYARHGNIALKEYKALYFPIPKVACSSLKLAIADLIDVSSPDPSNRMARPHHRNYPYVKQDVILKTYASYFRFTFVRNPWDRVLSCYQNKIADVQKGIRKKTLPPHLKDGKNVFSLDMSFEEFVEALMEIPDHAADPHYRSQHTFIDDSNGNELVNFIGRFESLQDDLKYVKTQLNAPQLRIPHVLKSSRDANYRHYYDTRTAKLIATRYAIDIDRFKYTF